MKGDIKEKDTNGDSVDIKSTITHLQSQRPVWKANRDSQWVNPYVLSVRKPKSMAGAESSIAEYFLNSQVLGYST